MAKHSRRVLSHHGSDCPNGPHKIREGRCLILTRIDRPGQRSEAWVSGDYAETMPMRVRRESWASDPEYAAELVSERVQRKRHAFDPNLPTWYGGGFWERVAIGPVAGIEPAPECAVLARQLGDRYRS